MTLVSRAKPARRLAASLLVLGAALTFAPHAAAQTPPAAAAPATAPAAPVYTPTSLAVARDVPRTRDGHPDVTNVVWETPFFAGLTGIPLLSPTQLVITEQQATTSYNALINTFATNPAIALDPELPMLLADGKGYPIVRGQRRSRLLVMPANGRVPLTPAANTELGAALAASMVGGTGKADNPEDRTISERCISLGAIAPMVFLSSLHPRSFMVTPTHVVVQVEYGDEVRVIPFSASHGAVAPEAPFGDSIARWEGDTLVIETTRSPANQRLRPSPFGGGLVVNANAKVIERYTRVSADEMIYQFTVEDPSVYTAPWLAEYSMFRADFRMFPSSCHEGNYGLENILAGAREFEKTPRGLALAAPVTESTAEPAVRWTPAATTVNDTRSWAVLAPKDSAGEARVALRIEYGTPTPSPVGAAAALSEINVFAIDCAGQRLKRVSWVTYGARNLSGEKHEQATAADAWLSIATRPAIAAGIQRACT